MTKLIMILVHAEVAHQFKMSRERILLVLFFEFCGLRKRIGQNREGLRSKCTSGNFTLTSKCNLNLV